VNERIKQLAEQAGILSKPRQLGPAPVIQPDVLNPLRKYVSDEDYIQDNFDVVRSVLGGNGLEMFAVLIIQECSKIIVNGGYWSGGPLGPKRPCTPPEIAQMIKEHFGVE
jgi:hypothetical protein